MEMAAIAAVTIIAGAFRGVTGFGYAMVAALGLTAALMAPQSSVPFILFNDLVLTAFTLGDRKIGAVDWKAARLLLASGFCGAFFGGWSAAHLDEETARILVAAIVMLAACVALIRNPPAWLAGRVFGVFFGFAVGLLLSAFAVGGPLAAAWLLAGGTQRSHVRGTLAVFFGAIDLVSLASRVFLGEVDPQLPWLIATYLPATLVGFAVGYIVSRRLQPHVWHRFSSGGLVTIAIIGLIQAVFALVAA
ncbi:sulfite exporter TauE/SafE family protein [Agrobacterium sp. SORGH_AS 787]|uniref:sulfite exporter TauE/SafE family protein n=1 Tax=Agrobacterium sp. SORGH_AS 787 TaxID=3041775 RepID=UPI00277EB7F8|nr:putative membrane protein YfcA [Rhizobium sp. SORGH_AS_0787]